jgi:zinc transport system ATP-binding protein
VNLIDVKDLSFSYENEPLFSDISFSVKEGDCTAVIGSNGAGKSTLMRLILGELQPDKGSVSLFGQDVRQFKDWHKVGYVKQSGLQDAINFPATAKEIVLANLYSQIGMFRFPKKEHKEKAMAALESVGMADYADKTLGEMSGGQRQRVALAMLLVADPMLLLLDEPVSGVDSKNVAVIYEILTRLNEEQGKTILMITHDTVRVSGYVNRMLCIEDGCMIEEGVGHPDVLAHYHQHHFIRTESIKGRTADTDCCQNHEN